MTRPAKDLVERLVAQVHRATVASGVDPLEHAAAVAAVVHQAKVNGAQRRAFEDELLSKSLVRSMPE